MLTDESSMRLNMLRFPLIVGVVFIHNYDMNVVLQGATSGLSQADSIFDFVRNLISQGLARLAVPLFFIISGYLFSYGFDLSIDGFIAKLKSRFNTLLVPFIFWNVVTLIVIAVAQATPSTAVYFSGKNALIANYSGADYFSAIFGIGRQPISYQFWFIRDLLVMVIFSPIILVLCKYLGTPFLLALLAMWSTEFWPIPVPSSEAALFFSIGCWLGVGNKNIFMLDTMGAPIAAIYVIGVISDAILNGTTLGYGIHKISILFGITTALWITKAAIRSETIKQHLLRLGGASFFLFATHEPLLVILKKVLFKFLQPQSPYMLLCLYFAIPSIIVILILMMQAHMQAVFPRFMRVVNGGR